MRAHVSVTFLFQYAGFCDFYAQVNSIQAHAEEEMKKLSNKWRKKETQMKKDNQAEKEKVRNNKWPSFLRRRF